MTPKNLMRLAVAFYVLNMLGIVAVLMATR
jgi:hypothetical protein